LATAAIDISPEYDELFDRLADASAVADGDEVFSRLVSSPWAWSSPTDETWEELRVEAKRRLGRTSISSFQRRATLGIVMAWLKGFELEDAAALIGTSPPRLVAWLHGEMSIPRSKDVRLKQK
jgi:hypothetical protein